MTLGEKIRQQREAKGMTQLELAQKIGYTTTGAVSLIESGKRDISIDKVREIAKALDVTPHWLMGWSDSPLEIKTDLELRLTSLKGWIRNSLPEFGSLLNFSSLKEARNEISDSNEASFREMESLSPDKG